MIFLSIAPMNRSSSIFNEIKAKKKKQKKAALLQ